MTQKLLIALALLCATLGLAVAAHAAIIVNGEDLRARLLRQIYSRFQTQQRWCGKSADQSGTTWMSTSTMTPFGAGAEASQWGAVSKLVGSTDTPIVAGNIAFNVRHIYIIDVAFVESGPVKLRIIWGSETASAAVAANQCTEIMVPHDDVEVTLSVMMPRVAAQTKVWAQMWAADAEATFLIGIAEHI